MAVPEIVDIAECVQYIGKATTLTDAELALLTQIKPFGEDAVRKYIGSSVTQATFTHFLPKNNSYQLRWGQNSIGQILRLPEFPLRSVTSVNVDRGAYAGTASGSFGSGTAWTEGTEFFPDIDESGISRFGHVVAINREWPADPRSIKIIYTAGWSAAELRGDVTNPRIDASGIRLGTLKTIAAAYSNAVNSQTSNAVGSTSVVGPISSEKIDNYAVTYAGATSTTTYNGSGVTVSVPDAALGDLKMFRRRNV